MIEYKVIIRKDDNDSFKSYNTYSTLKEAEIEMMFALRELQSEAKGMIVPTVIDDK